MRNTYINFFARSAASFFIFVLILEGYLFFFKGLRLDWRTEINNLYTNMAGYEEFAKHVGYVPKVGTVVSIEDFSVLETVWPNGMRECRKNIDKKSKINVAFVGCSFTFGQGVAAPETMVYRLNEKYPDVTFDNWGVCGWGAMQVMERVKVLAESKKYDLIVFDAIGALRNRNTYMSIIHGGVEPNRGYIIIPYKKRDKIWGGYETHYSDDNIWPFQERLLCLDILRRLVLSYQVSYAKKHYSSNNMNLQDQHDFSKVVNSFVHEMENSCMKNSVDFLVCGLDSKVVYEVFPYLTIKSPIINIDHPKSDMPEYRVRGNPVFHPNAKAHAYWAEKFSEWFDKQNYRKK